MLEALFSSFHQSHSPPTAATLKMTSHARMGGSVPVWSHEEAETAQKSAPDTNSLREIELRFERVLSNTPSGMTAEKTSAPLSPYSNALQNSSAFPVNETLQERTEKPFGFGDIFDMLNPLHHLPVVGALYRELSGDDIRGPGKVIGGALFGGPLGAASSFVNMIIEHDTGKDIAGHAMGILRGDEARAASATPREIQKNPPLAASENASATAERLPSAQELLAYTQTEAYPKSHRYASLGNHTFNA